MFLTWTMNVRLGIKEESVCNVPFFHQPLITSLSSLLVNTLKENLPATVFKGKLFNLIFLILILEGWLRAISFRTNSHTYREYFVKHNSKTPPELEKTNQIRNCSWVMICWPCLNAYKQYYIYRQNQALKSLWNGLLLTHHFSWYIVHSRVLQKPSISSALLALIRSKLKENMCEKISKGKVVKSFWVIVWN